MHGMTTTISEMMGYQIVYTPPKMAHDEKSCKMLMPWKNTFFSMKYGFFFSLFLFS